MALKVFLDANILISVVNKEFPLYNFSSRILSLAGKSGFNLNTSVLCLAITFYFAEKKHGQKIAKQKLQLLNEHIGICVNSEASVIKALADPKVVDFEDGLQYYAALESGCNCIITENIADFHFSDMEVIDSKNFCKTYLF